MARAPRIVAAGVVYHVLNRANAGGTLFSSPSDYAAYEEILAQAQGRVDMRIVAYCLMPTHWHMVLWPRRDHDIAAFVAWATTTHVRRWHAFRRNDGTGHLYQGRYKSFPVQTDAHFLTVCRYVERNPVRASVVTKAEAWPWSSLRRHVEGLAEDKIALCEWPLPRPPGWTGWVNEPLTQAELSGIRKSVVRGSPYGADDWVRKTATALHLESTTRGRGRPKKT